VSLSNFQVIELRGDDDRVEIVAKDGAERVCGYITSQTMQDLRYDAIPKSERVQYARDRLAVLSKLIAERYCSTRIINIEITLNDLEILAAGSAP